MKKSMNMPNKIFPASVLTLILFGCSSGPSGALESTAKAADTPVAAPVITSELAYLKKYAGKYAWQEKAFDSEPFHTRLKALVGSHYDDLMRDMSVQSPVHVGGDTLVIGGCRPHWCGITEGLILVDLVKDNILVGHRVKNKIDAYQEKASSGDLQSATFLKWAGKDPVREDKKSGGTPNAKGIGSFNWTTWEKAGTELKNRLKGLRQGRGKSEYEQVEFAVKSRCRVYVAEYDLNADGKPGLLIAKTNCSMFCGSAGCNIEAYDGGRMLSVNDQWDQVKPGRNGVVSSVGVLIPLR